ncbi:unnamed protein product [Hermetia illucens]|uniref:Uncharacterized protein n=1 Tax=Hermetia illucens TaxID=343691 RepID=A0A7R8Z312_HERIL|nr:unnamed protein product [Hermetia illucens]
MATPHSPIFRLQRFLQAEEFRNLSLTPIGMREIRKFTCETVHRSVDNFVFNVRAFFFLGPSPQFSDKCILIYQRTVKTRELIQCAKDACELWCFVSLEKKQFGKNLENSIEQQLEYIISIPHHLRITIF